MIGPGQEDPPTFQQYSYHEKDWKFVVLRRVSSSWLWRWRALQVPSDAPLESLLHHRLLLYRRHLPFHPLQWLPVLPFLLKELHMGTSFFVLLFCRGPHTLDSSTAEVNSKKFGQFSFVLIMLGTLYPTMRIRGSFGADSVLILLRSTGIKASKFIDYY